MFPLSMWGNEDLLSVGRIHKALGDIDVAIATHNK